MNVLITKLVTIFTLSYLRYLVFAGLAYLIFYVWKKRDWFHLKIQKKFPGKEQMLREAGYSTLSIFIFAWMGLVVFWLHQHGHTKIYDNFSNHSVWYFLFSAVVFILAHDAYFYWTHRLMHWEKIYKYVHRTHHLSTNPTPWAAFAFHPSEAVIEVSILFIMVFAIPLHPAAIVVWILYMTLLNVMGHVGFEIFPKGFTTHPIWKYQNTSVHHNMHHRLVRCNYGLYFNYWDRWCGTNHADYHKEFEAVKSRSEAITNEELRITEVI
ncbi:MAG: sterol desaturase family protein [Chitinophagales bacterium]